MIMEYSSHLMYGIINHRRRRILPTGIIISIFLLAVSCRQERTPSNTANPELGNYPPNNAATARDLIDPESKEATDSSMVLKDGERSSPRQTHPPSKNALRVMKRVENFTVSNVAPSGVERRIIRTLIEELEEIRDVQSFGIIGYSDSHSFELAQVGLLSKLAGELPAHDVPATIRELIQYGPKALPILIQNINNPQHTQAQIHSPDSIVFADRPAVRWQRTVDGQENVLGPRLQPRTIHEYSPWDRKMLPAQMARNGQSANQKSKGEAETERLSAESVIADLLEQDDAALDEYSITVGDLCYAIIGEITNRVYAFAQEEQRRVFISSPTQDEMLAQDIKRVWDGKQSQEELLRSLAFDTLHQSDSTLFFMPGAVRRLILYFPKESEPYLHEEFKRINAVAKRTRSVPYSLIDEVFVESLTLLDSMNIRNEMLGLFEKTRDPYFFIATLRLGVVNDQGLAEERLKELLNSIDEEEWITTPIASNHIYGYLLLTAARNYMPEKAESICREVLSKKSIGRCAAAARAFNGLKSPRLIDLFVPLLDDKRIVRRVHPKTYAPIRVCDEAAILIGNADERVTYRRSSSETQNDRQIEAMKTVLARSTDEL